MSYKLKGYSHNTTIKLGSILPSENLNVEYKKFQFDKDSEKIKNNINDIEYLFNTGKINETVNNIILDILEEYIMFYIPKYTACFLNNQHLLDHEKSFFIIGIDDDGTMGGIPINFDLKSLPEVINFINRAITNAVSKVILHSSITHNEIISCLKSSIVTINKTSSTFLDIKAIANHKTMAQYKKDIIEANKELEEQNIRKLDLLFLTESLTIYAFKINDTINKKLFEFIVKNFPIQYDKNNNSHTDFLFKVMISFNPLNYLGTYQNIINANNKIENYINNDINTRALGTYFHEEIKTLVTRIKDKSVIIYKEQDEKNKKLQKMIDIKKGEHDVLKYNLNNYSHLINKYNSYILIKIDFDNRKYKDIIKEKLNKINKTFNHDEYLLSYINKKNQDAKENIYTPKRGFRLHNNRLEPECYNATALQKN